MIKRQGQVSGLLDRLQTAQDNNNIQRETVNEEVLSLRDPMTLKRIKNPCRTMHCKHLACFDLKIFLENQKAMKKEWKCPCCKISTDLSSLIVDTELLAFI